MIIIGAKTPCHDTTFLVIPNLLLLKAIAKDRFDCGHIFVDIFAVERCNPCSLRREIVCRNRAGFGGYCDLLAGSLGM